MSLSQLKSWISSNKLVLILITVYFLISIIKIEHPGVNNDQLMFVNAATIKEENYFLWKSFNGIPTMIFPYIGALKSYLYLPIFYIFGVNIWSIRLPHIIIISISLFLLYKTLILSFNKKIALLTILLLAFDPSQVIYSKIDTGPTVLEFFLKVLTIYLFSLFVKTKQKIIFLSIYPILFLGIFNKINFFWFVNAFMFSSLLLYGRNFYNNFKSLGRFVPLILIVIPYFALLRFFIKLSRETVLSYRNFSNEISLENIFTNFPIFYKNLIEVINGNLFFNIAYGHNPTDFGIPFSILLISLLFLGMFIILVRKSKFIKSYIFITLITVLISLQILLTKRAISAWHFLAVYPFFTIIFAAGIFHLYTVVKSKIIKKMIIVLICLIVVYQLQVNFLYINKYSQPTKSVALSSTIYDLINYTKNNHSKFVCLDADICNQLLSFDQEKNKYFEPFSFLDESTYRDSFARIVGNFNKPDEFLYIAHADANSHFLALKLGFFKFLKDSDVEFIKIQEFTDGNNIIYEIYKVGYALNPQIRTLDRIN